MIRIIKFLSFFLLVASCTQSSQQPTFRYPKAHQVVSIDTFFSKILKDPYRSLENAKDSLVKQWYDAQGTYTDSILSSIDNRKELAAFLNEIDNRRDYYIRRLRIVEDQYFYLKKDGTMDRFHLFYRDGFNGEERELYSPKEFKPETSNKYVINYMNPSHDGRYVVIGLTYDGREYSEMVVYDMEQQRVLPQVIDHCWPSAFYGVSWLPDGSGFVYLHFPNLYKDSKVAKTNSQAVLYKLGSDPKNVTVLLSAINNPELQLHSENYPIVQIKNKNDKYVIANMVDVTNFYDAYYTSIDELMSGRPSWKPLYKKEEEVYRTSSSFQGDTLYFRQSKDAPNQQISRLNIEPSSGNISPIEIVVSEKSDEVIKGYNVSEHGLYYSTLRNGVEAKLYQHKNSIDKAIELPKGAGKLSLSSRLLPSNKVSIYLSGWVNSSERFEFDVVNHTFEKKDLRPSGAYPEFEDFIVEEVEVKGYDGAMIPLSIVRHKDMPFNSENPVFMEVYGAYGDNTSPYFSPVLLSWVAKGGIYACAHVRGGGEKGTSWHKAGQKTTKPNSWKDLISCMEYMIDNKYTSNEKSVIWSSSAGGIAIGRAMTERPDLFKVSIAEVAALNQFRSSEISGGTNYKEFGSVKDSVECMALIEMDAYLKLKKRTNYPATLVTAGMNDPRVAPWESGKFVARLQEENTSANPILFAVYKDSGHGGDSTIDQIYQEWANVFAFALWQTGHSEFQLVE